MGRLAVDHSEPFRRSFGRLAEFSARAVGPGLLLASASFLLFLIAGTAFGPASLYVFILLHGLFVSAITRFLFDPPASWEVLYDSRVLLAGIGVTLAITPFALLDMEASDFICADGKLRPSAIPPLPWFLIGWAALLLAAVPTRLLGWGRQVRLLSLPHRIVLTAPFAILVMLLGKPFLTKRMDCEPPFDGWGLFEGGLFLLPLLGLFLFVASLSAAVLSATFVAGGAKD